RHSDDGKDGVGCQGAREMISESGRADEDAEPAGFRLARVTCSLLGRAMGRGELDLHLDTEFLQELDPLGHHREIALAAEDDADSRSFRLAHPLPSRVLRTAAVT